MVVLLGPQSLLTHPSRRHHPPVHRHHPRAPGVRQHPVRVPVRLRRGGPVPVLPCGGGHMVGVVPLGHALRMVPQGGQTGTDRGVCILH